MRELAIKLVERLNLTELRLNGKSDYQTVSPHVTPYASALGVNPNRLVWACIDCIRASKTAPIDEDLLDELKDLR